MSKIHFNEFEPISEKAWKQKIQVDLRGKDYNESMLTATDEGIDIKPFYHQDSSPNFSIPTPEKWYITKKTTLNEINKIQHFKDEGHEAFWVNLDSNKNLPSDLNHKNAPIILKLKTPKDIQYKDDKDLYYSFDPINTLVTSGNWKKNQADDFKEFEYYFSKAHTISLDARIYHNSGGNITQQLAYMLAQLEEYLKKINPKHEQKVKILIFNAVGPNYFFEIAKLKAYRLLVNTLCKSQKISFDLKIISEPGLHYKSIYDYNINILRSTTECMSAILGGSDFVRNMPYDEVFKNENNFSERISKNQLLILKNESYFDKVENPAEGCYYVNQITKTLAEKALDLFKAIEQSGGFIQQLFEGKIQSKIHKQFQNNIEKFDQRKLKLIGVNEYVNPEDRLKSMLEKEIETPQKKRKTLIKPILSQRIAQHLELERLSKEEV